MPTRIPDHIQNDIVASLSSQLVEGARSVSFRTPFGVPQGVPPAGRWLSENPLGYKGGDLNLYRYANNNPINHTDPSGKALLVKTCYLGVEGAPGNLAVQGDILRDLVFNYLGPWDGMGEETQRKAKRGQTLQKHWVRPLLANARCFSLRKEVSRVLVVVLVGCDQVSGTGGITLNAYELSVIRAVHRQHDAVSARADLIAAPATEPATKAASEATTFFLWGLLG